MRIAIVCPAPPRSRSGNRATALRWRRLLGELGHDAAIVERLGRHRADVVVALHAVKSADSVERARRDVPERPIVVALTGTDLYGALAKDARRDEVLRLADRLVVLHPGAEAALPRWCRARARFVPQSAAPLGRPARRSRRGFDVVVVGHLREVKDPFRAAWAARLLPPTSRVRVIQVGAALDPAMAREARREAQTNPRYRWVGEVSAARARAHVAAARVLVLSSKLEGGANVLSEAIAAGTPVLASRIACAVGLLGEGYGGLFRFGDTGALARLLSRAEADPAFLARLAAETRARRALVSKKAEARAWRRLLAELRR